MSRLSEDFRINFRFIIDTSSPRISELRSHIWSQDENISNNLYLTFWHLTSHKDNDDEENIWDAMMKNIWSNFK